MTPSETILKLKQISLWFGGVRAVENVSFSVRKGSVHALIGPNGAGKSCLFGLICGSLESSHGEILFRSSDITTYPVTKRTKLGISRTFQVASIFPHLSVYENLRVAILGATQKYMNPFKNESKHNNESIKALLSEFSFYDKRDMLAGALSHGDRQLLDILLGLALRPQLLLLDEPTQGMEPAQSERVLERLRFRAKETGLTILFTEHDLSIIRRFPEYITFLVAGEVRMDGPTSEVVHSIDFQNIYHR